MTGSERYEDVKMSFFEQMGSIAQPKVDEAEVKLDLCGMEKPDALAKLDATVKYCKKTNAATLYIYFDAAKPGEGETLFQPVARYFRFEKHNGYISSAVPVMTPETGGLFVTFKNTR